MDVKRGKISTDKNETELGDPSFSDLPRDIMINVLLRLPVKRVLVCRSVCKTWYGLITEPGFAKLHFDRAEAYPLIHISSSTKPSRTFHLVPPEEENKLEISYDSECYTIKHLNDKKYGLVNSCNGLLCLSHPYDKDPVFVCNPVTGEFVDLHKKGILNRNVYRCGFGYSPASNQYKVIRILFQRYNGIGAQVYTLGTKTWKDIEFSAKNMCGLGPTYLNGFLYWPEYGLPYSVLSFDIENECFSSILVPSMGKGSNGVSIGVLAGELCMYCFLSSGEARVRVMKDDGTTKVWSEVFSIQLINWNPRWDLGLCEPIRLLNDGAMLVFNSNMNSLIYKHPRRHGIRCFHFCREDEKLQVTAHIPSFVSLKKML